MTLDTHRRRLWDHLYMLWTLYSNYCLFIHHGCHSRQQIEGCRAWPWSIPGQMIVEWKKGTHGRPDVNKTGVSVRDCTLPGAGWSCLGWKPIFESKSWQHYGACSGLFAIWAILEGLCWEDCQLNISLSRGRSRVPSEVLFNWERKMRRLWWKQCAAKFSAMEVEKGLTWFEAKTCPYLYDSMIHYDQVNMACPMCSNRIRPEGQLMPKLTWIVWDTKVRHRDTVP